MAEHVYSLTVGGTTTGSTIAELGEILRSDEDLSGLMTQMGCEIPGVEDLANAEYFRVDFDRASDDDLTEVTQFCREHNLAYEIHGYSTCSDVHFSECWMPGMDAPRSVDTDDSYWPVTSLTAVKQALDWIFGEPGPYTKERIQEAFSGELADYWELPHLELAEEGTSDE